MKLIFTHKKRLDRFEVNLTDRVRSQNEDELDHIYRLTKQTEFPGIYIKLVYILLDEDNDCWGGEDVFIHGGGAYITKNVINGSDLKIMNLSRWPSTGTEEMYGYSITSRIWPPLWGYADTDLFLLSVSRLDDFGKVAFGCQAIDEDGGDVAQSFGKIKDKTFEKIGKLSSLSGFNFAVEVASIAASFMSDWINDDDPLGSVSYLTTPEEMWRCPTMYKRYKVCDNKGSVFFRFSIFLY